MAREPYIPSEAELAGAPQPFLYELRMFRETTDVFIEHSPLITDLTLKRVFLESALVHARNLLDFFTCEPSSKDDILAVHFLTPADERQWRPSGLAHLASRRDDINKALSHLTYTRVNNKPAWPFGQIRVEIEQAYGEFLEELPETDRPKWQA